MRTLVCRLLVALICVFWLRCHSAIAEEKFNDCVNIGVLTDFKRINSNSEHFFGAQIRRGVSVALSVLGKQSSHRCFNRIDFDIGHTVANISSVIDYAVKNRNTRIFIGLSLSAQVEAAVSQLKKHNALLISPTATDDKFSSPGGRIIQMTPRNELIAASLAKQATELGIKKAIIVFSENVEVNRHAKEEFEKAFERLGGSILKSFPVRGGNADLSPFKDQLISLDYDGVFMPLFELDVAKAFSVFSELHLKKTLIGTFAWGNYFNVAKRISFVNSDLTALVPMLYYYARNSGNNREFYRVYNTMFDDRPTHLAAFSFDSLILLEKLFRHCSERQILDNPQACLENVLPFVSTTGTVNRAENLNLLRELKTEIIDRKYGKNDP